nr:MAG TPA: hypothetical protein [Caudoviricetes sp.]
MSYCFHPLGCTLLSSVYNCFSIVVEPYPKRVLAADCPLFHDNDCYTLVRCPLGVSSN